MRYVPLFGVVTLLASMLRADGPQDNLADKVRRVPPPGIKLSDEDRQFLSVGRDALGKEIDGLRNALKGKPALLDLLPDVQIFYNAVHYALKYDEFFKLAEITVAKNLLAHGFDRARELRDGKPSWPSAIGLVVRGYVSKIDGSVQPYGLVVPASYRPGTAVEHRLDLWFHGRGEVLSEVSFLDGRMKSPGEFTPPHAFVLHPYGRYCNANHFAGEIDALEALAHAKKNYAIDDNRIVARGFSMGGAACWGYAVHYADRWVGRPLRAPAFRRRPISCGCSRTNRTTRPGTRRSCCTGTTAPTGRSTFFTVRRLRTAVKRTSRSRRPTLWRRRWTRKA